jgi:glycosyltransferase involved in cell wall biosynthesis
MVKVSVLIPTYNYGKFLGEAIQSVLDQTFKDFEIIVLDDGSTDNTREVVGGFRDPRVRYVYHDHIGVSAAENLALRLSNGEYITDMGADDVYLPRNLEMKVKILDSNPDLGLVYSDAYLFDHNTKATLGRLWRDAKGSHRWIKPAKAACEPLKELLRRGCFIQIQTSLIRRCVFEEIGYLDESLITHEDWELMVRIVQRFACEMIDMPLVKCRRHAGNLSDNQEKMYRGGVAAGNKVLRKQPLKRNERQILKQRLLSQHISYGRKALLNNREAAARKSLIAAIKLHPWKFKLYVYMIMSIMGTGNYLMLRNLKKILRRWLHA